MTIDQLKTSLHDPLGCVLHLVSGCEITIPHPDYASISPNGSTIVVVSDENIEIIRSNQIESISRKPAA